MCDIINMLMYDYWSKKVDSEVEKPEQTKEVKEYSKVEESDELLPRLYRYLSKFEVLNRKQESDLFIRYQKHGDLKARELIELHNMKLVISIAKKFTSSGIAEEDLIQFGFLGMRKALDKFDLSKGNKFSTYVTWWIRQNISRSIANTARSVRVPAYLVDECKRYKKTTSTLSKKLMRAPTEIELCWAMNIDAAKLNTIKNCLNSVASLDHSTSSSDEEADPLIASIEDDTSNFVQLEDINHDILKAVNKLPNMESKVIELKYLRKDDLTNERIGTILGISKVKVAAYLKKGIESLQNSSLKNY